MRWRSLGDSNPCFRRERASFSYLIVLAALAPACPRPRVWPARASVLAGAQHHIRVGPVLRIKERIAPDPDPRIALAERAQLTSDLVFTRICAHRPREHANADFELRRHLIEHRLHDRGYARHHDHIADPEAGRPWHLVEERSAPLGMRVMRRRASFISA